MIWQTLQKEREALKQLEDKERPFLVGTMTYEEEIEQSHENIGKTVSSLLRSFNKLFDALTEAAEVDEQFVQNLELEPIFEIGSQLVELAEINEKDKARFLV